MRFSSAARSIVMLAATLACALATPARGQITPQRLYNGLDRPLPVRVELPADGGAERVTLRFYGPPSPEAADDSSYGTMIAEAQADPGEVDLASLLDNFWTLVNKRVTYVQAFAGERPVGSPLVLQGMRTPANARSAQNGVRFQIPPRRVFTGVRAYVDKLVRLETTEGAIDLRLRPDAAPNTAYNFRHLVEGGYYTDIIFHRIIGPSPAGDDGFVIQVGDPTGTGGGGPGYFIDLEQSTLSHDFGIVSMARTSQPDTNGSQIFICLSRERTQGLDDRYAAFGEAVDGADTIMTIATVETGPRDRPQGTPPRIESARLIDAPALTERGPRVTMPETGGR